MKKLFLIFVGLIFLSDFNIAQAAGLCSGAPSEYVMEPIKGKIVDEETGVPIEGAIVVAFWKVVQPHAFMKIQEAVTDTKGEFFFSGWGPLKRPKESCFLDEDPYLKFFKPGYKTRGGANTYYPERAGSPDQTLVNPVSSHIRKSRYHGAEIKLTKFVIGAQERHTLLSTGETVTHTLTEKDWCENIHFSLDVFGEVRATRSNITFSLPTFRQAMNEERKLHKDCFDGISLNMLETQ